MSLEIVIRRDKQYIVKVSHLKSPHVSSSGGEEYIEDNYGEIHDYN